MIKMKTSISFDANKALEWVKSKEYQKIKSETIAKPMANHYRKFIKDGKVTPSLSNKTIHNRRNRLNKPSIGGDKPLYDTGKLADSIRYDEKNQSIKAISYAKEHIDGGKWGNVNLPERDFVTQAEKEKPDIGLDRIRREFKRKFSRKLAK